MGFGKIPRISKLAISATDARGKARRRFAILKRNKRKRKTIITATPPTAAITATTEMEIDLLVECEDEADEEIGEDEIDEVKGLKEVADRGLLEDVGVLVDDRVESDIEERDVDKDAVEVSELVAFVVEVDNVWENVEEVEAAKVEVIC